MSKTEQDFIAVYPIPEKNGTKFKSAQETVNSSRAAFATGKTKSLAFRRNALKQLLHMLEENTGAFVNCMKEDFGRPRHETIVMDVEFSSNEIKRILNNFENWAKPTYPTKPLAFLLDGIKILSDPYGVVLILGCWNYPLTLLLTPLAGAIAAGNCVIMKPSEIAGATAELLATLLPKYLDNECYQVYPGGVEETKLLLEDRFDYIFFTGSTRVGRLIHASANKFLTPVTLEMGGKTPVYIDNTADLQITVRRILWGKCNNAGQTCIAPDYVLCSEDIQKKFVPIARQVIKEWFGDDIKSSPDLARIINDSNYNRLVEYLSDNKNIALGGGVDPTQRFIEPTILINVSPNNPVMLDEIFGPILPFITVKNMYEAVSFINAREKPLALYIFSKEKNVKNFFICKTSSGSVVVNDTLVQYGVLDLPFGGVGFSGIGKYHGKDSFDTFVHKKSVMEKGFNVLLEKALALRYPPYSSGKTSFLNIMLQTRKRPCLHWVKYVFMFCLGVVFMIALQVIYYNATNKKLL